MQLLNRIVTFRNGEATTAWLMFTYSFLAMTSYNIVKPMTRSTFIRDLGSDNLPYVQLAAALLIGVMMDVYVRLGKRLPRSALIPVTQGALVAVLLTFWVLFQRDAVWVSAAFYLFGLLFGILIISQFWTLANEIYDARQARRIFGFIGGGAALGGMLGNGILSLGATVVGTTNLLVVSAAVLLACLGIVTFIVRRHEPSDLDAAIETGKGVGGSEAIRLLQESRHLQTIALVIGFAAIGAVTIEQQLNMATEASGENLDEMTQFLGSVGFSVSLVAFIIQVGLTSRIHRWMGLTFALLLLPVSLGGSGVVILLSALRWAPAAARVLDSALRYSIDKTTREVLFLPLPSGVKNRAKPFVDVTVDRFAKGLGSIALLVLIKPWGFGVSWVQLSYFSLAMMALWVGVALVARREYLRLFRRSLDSRAIEPEAVRLDVAGPATIEALVEGLASPDETAVLYAIDMLETLDKRHLVTPLLLHHDSPLVRVRALTALETAGAERSGPWEPMVERMLKDQDPRVRAAAVRVLAVLKGEEASSVLRRFLLDDEPRVVMTAAAELADSGRPADEVAAEAAFARIVDDTRAGAAGARRDAAAALARVRNPRVRSLLIPLIHDPDVRVAAEAIASARTLGPSDALFVPALVSRLGHRLLKAAAREALLSYGNDGIGLLAHALTDPNENTWVRRHVPATLARIPTQRSMDALVAGMETPDGFLRFKVISALETLHRDHPELTFPASAVERVLVWETGRYYTYLTLRFNLVARERSAERSLIVSALDDKLTRTMDRVFHLMGLIYPWKDIAAARYALKRGEARRRAAALEFLDHTLTGEIRKRVMPMLDDSPSTEKVRHAYSVLKSRPRDVVETLAQLIHEDDEVIAASAIHFAVEQRLHTTLSGDLEYVSTHRSGDSVVHGAAAWVPSQGRVTAVPDETAMLPVVELASRLRAIPLFGYVWVDELFRVASAARQVRYEPGSPLCMRGDPAAAALFLLEGRVRVSQEESGSVPVLAPTTFGVVDVLEGRPVRYSVYAVEPSIGLALDRGDLLTMLADNGATVQGLFRMFLGPEPQGQVVVHTSQETAERHAAGHVAAPLNPVEKAALLRRTHIFGDATVEQLRDLVAAAREIGLVAGGILFEAGSQPATYLVIDGEVEVQESDGSTSTVRAGRTLGLSESLTRNAMRGRATVTRGGRALEINPDDLFDVLSNHTDLLQQLFGYMLGTVGTGSPIVSTQD
jgi:ATP/ADP translocase/HEAT repeat protein/CRP-like cAMP-binding protein